MVDRYMQIIFLVVLLLSASMLESCSPRPARMPRSDLAQDGSSVGPATEAQAADPVPVAAPTPSAPQAVAAVTPAPSDSSAARTPVRVEEFVEHPELSDIYFGPGRFDIGRDAARALEALARWLKTNDRASLLIEGHSDSLGTQESNRALAERRAKAALNYLVKQGVSPSRMLIMIYGADHPACAEQTAACMAKNRRVRFLVKGR